MPRPTIVAVFGLVEVRGNVARVRHGVCGLGLQWCRIAVQFDARVSHLQCPDRSGFRFGQLQCWKSAGSLQHVLSFQLLRAFACDKNLSSHLVRSGHRSARIHLVRLYLVQPWTPPLWLRCSSLQLFATLLQQDACHHKLLAPQWLLLQEQPTYKQEDYESSLPKLD